VPAIFRDKLDRPEPRVAVGQALRTLATACIDVSDGFAADLEHLLKASDCGARINVNALPSSDALCAALPEAEQRLPLLLAGGDDYELCFCAPSNQAEHIYRIVEALDCPVTEVGEILTTPGLQFRYDDGRNYMLSATGYDHFRTDST
jgi:thiamine-monophosphate kinase